MRRRRLALAPLVAALLVVTGCGGATEPEVIRADGTPTRVVSEAEATALADVVAATTRMGATMLALAPQEENAVVSPASMSVALAMLAEGARGETLSDLDRALGASGEARRDAFAALRQALLAFDGDPAEATGDTLPERPIVHLANRVVLDEGFDVHPEYLTALADVFDSGIQYADLGAQSAKKVLSEWIEWHTGGLIKESAIEPKEDLRLVLQDALLLAARWQTPLAPEGTMPWPFTLADGSEVSVETMHTASIDLAFAEVDGWQGVRLPYLEALHADVLLPPKGIDPAGASPQLLAEMARALDVADSAPLTLGLPTLDVDGETLDLIDSGIFDALGVGAVLCDGAPDLSGVALSPGELCIAQAAQQAVLTVDQEGTVAAAVTEIGAVESSAPVADRTVAFDRPFLFTIAHSETAWPLFLAAVRDPRH